MTYVVQIYTFCEGWVNTWCIEDEEDGTSVPETFPTRAAAEAALDEFFAEIAEEIEVGQRAPDDGYDEDDFRIVKAGAS